jgi:hypothetical protein
MPRDPVKHKAAQQRYNQSDKGKANHQEAHVAGAVNVPVVVPRALPPRRPHCRHTVPCTHCAGTNTTKTCRYVEAAFLTNKLNRSFVAMGMSVEDAYRVQGTD